MVGCLSAASIAIATVYVLVCFLCVSCVFLVLLSFGLLVFGMFVLWDDFVLVLFFFC